MSGVHLSYIRERKRVAPWPVWPGNRRRFTAADRFRHVTRHFATLRISAPPRKTPSQTTVPRLGLTVIYKIFIHQETATAQKHSNTSSNVNKTKATTKSVIIQMTHGGEWTLKYDEPEAESHHISMSHERPCFICFVVWPTTSLKLYIVF